jgi:formylglycine-generating enzyme required for sulfatase activity
MMGSPASEVGRCDNETQHEVAISKAFWLGQTPVTQVQWEAVMGTQPSYYCGNPNHPVEKISWQDATAFCRCLSEATGMAFRLPTEAEWEYACRAGTAATYSFGDDPSSLGENAWFEDNSGGSTNPVAMKKSNRWGLYDMHGNVWEWCSDWYEDYSLNAATDPEGPKSGLYRVVRGGSWINSSMACRAARRINDVPGGCTHALGFRVARSP